MSVTYGPKLGKLINANIGDYYPDDFRTFLRSYDALVQGSVLDLALTTPPTSPNNGDAYIVPTSATGAWAGETNKVAVYSTEITVPGTNTKTPGWEFYTPNTGWDFYVVALSSAYVFNGTTWGGGGALSRTTASITTASLSTLGVENGTIAMAKTIGLIAIYASTQCRVRLYSTVAQQTLDAARPFSVPPTAGTQHGVICDLQLDNNSVPSGVFPTTWYMASPAFGSNCDTPPTANLYYSIENLSGTTSPVTVTFTYLAEEV